MALSRIKITSGPYAGRYVGGHYSGMGMVTNPDMRETPPVNITGANYGLWAQHGGATEFFQTASIQAELKALGIESEAEEVSVLDSILGMNLANAHAAEVILSKCKIRLQVPGTDCVHLFLGGDDELIVEKDETVVTLKEKIAKAIAKGYKKVNSHGS